MKNEELLSILNAVFTYFLKDCNWKKTGAKYTDAHQQIVALIEESASNTNARDAYGGYRENE